MSEVRTGGPVPVPVGAGRLARSRHLRDAVARWVFTAGGYTVLLAIVLMLGYLVWTVLPLFQHARVDARTEVGAVGEVRDTLAVVPEARFGRALRVSTGGAVEILDLEQGTAQAAGTLSLEAGETLHTHQRVPGASGRFVVGSTRGRVLLLSPDQDTLRRDGAPPAGDAWLGIESLAPPDGSPVDHLAVRVMDDVTLLARAAEQSSVVRLRTTKASVDLFGERTGGASQDFQVDLMATVTALAVGGRGRTVYAGDDVGRIHRIDVEQRRVDQVLDAPGGRVTSMVTLLGGTSLVVGTSEGRLAQYFPLRTGQQGETLVRVRGFEGFEAPVVRILPEARSKGFVAIDAEGSAALYHATAGVRRVSFNLPDTSYVAVAPRGDAVLTLGEDGRLTRVAMDNPHPEVNGHTLWGEVWYENYAEPRKLWQSTAASDDFEPKFSLAPLSFGTLKAALYAMLFAAPLALMGAIYTAFFMSVRLRRVVKPTIEFMEALPTVILGFLAGLWFAPIVERHLASILSVFVLLPLLVVAFAWAWTRPGNPWRDRLRRGWEPLLLVPVLVVLGWLAVGLAAPLEAAFFGGDLRTWLSREAGVSFDQRNAIIVGIAMGFAVIPTIFAIAEEAVNGVPRDIATSSLALGASSWQTLVRIVLPVASAGLLSALMVGFGRAVGETMIVLMASGNTPIMDASLFNGMRTLAANLAIELPESSVSSSHYRILFLCALLLFGFTFLVNTAAELIRMRLRRRYEGL